MRFTTNLKNCRPREFEPVQAGRYEAEIIGATPEKSLNGKPFLNIEFVVTSHPSQRRHIWTKLFMTDASVWKLATLFNAIDEPISEEADTDALIGKKLVITVKILDGEDGVPRNEVVAFKKLKSAVA